MPAYLSSKRLLFCSIVMMTAEERSKSETAHADKPCFGAKNLKYLLCKSDMEYNLRTKPCYDIQSIKPVVNVSGRLESK